MYNSRAVEVLFDDIEVLIGDGDLVEAAKSLIDFANEMEKSERRIHRNDAVILSGNVKTIAKQYDLKVISLEEYLRLRTQAADRMLALRTAIMALAIRGKK